MRDLTLVLPFYRNAGMLLEHQRIWASYPADIRARLHVIVVDDGSPKGFRASRKGLLIDGLGSLRLYRIGVDIRWNWLACRNLGVHEATTEWVLLTDIDHALPVETLRSLLDGELDTRHVYRLSRVDAQRVWPYALEDCPAYKPHPNTWLLTRRMFHAIGGYDERLSGCYGTDGEFRDRVYENASAVVLLPHVLIRYPREIVSDASTSPELFTRKNDPANDEDLRKRRHERELLAHWEPLRLTFPWTLEYSSEEAVPCR